MSDGCKTQNLPVAEIVNRLVIIRRFRVLRVRHSARQGGGSDSGGVAEQVALVKSTAPAEYAMEFANTKTAPHPHRISKGELAVVLDLERVDETAHVKSRAMDG